MKLRVRLSRLLSTMILTSAASSAGAAWTDFSISNEYYYGTHKVLYRPLGSVSSPVSWTDDYHYVTADWTVRPSGTTTQKMEFDFYSNNLFSKNNAVNHVAIGLRYSPSSLNAALNNENEHKALGIILRSRSATQVVEAPCAANSGTAEVENFFYSVALFQPTCSNMPTGNGRGVMSLSDGRWYHVVIHVHDNRTVAYTITDKANGALVTRAVQVPVGINNAGVVEPSILGPGLSTNRAGFTFRGISSADEWRVEIRSMTFGWF
jgi:hypothetical protein